MQTYKSYHGPDRYKAFRYYWPKMSEDMTRELVDKLPDNLDLHASAFWLSREVRRRGFKLSDLE